MFLYTDVDIIFYSFFFLKIVILFLELCNLMLKCFFSSYILCVFVFGKVQACFPHLVDEFSTWMLKAWVMLLMWACAESHGSVLAH